MKKYLYIFGIIISILIIIISVYVLFNIYFIVEVKDGKMYDGFGTPYHYQEPQSPYTIIGVGGFFGGGSLLAHCYSQINKNKHRQNIKKEIQA